MYTQFIKLAEEEAALARDIKSELFSEGGSAAIGALLGAAIGGIGGYRYSGMVDENLPEDKKFKKKLKNAIMAGALGALGGAGLGYGGAAALNTLSENEDNDSWIDSTVTSLAETPWSGTAIGAGAGAINASAKLGEEQMVTRNAYNKAVEKYNEDLEKARKLHEAKGKKTPFDPSDYGVKNVKVPKNIRGVDIYRKGSGMAKAVGLGIAADVIKSFIKSTY